MPDYCNLRLRFQSWLNLYIRPHHTRGAGNRNGAVIRSLASHQCGPLRLTPAHCRMLIVLVVGSRHARFTKANISKFQFHQDKKLSVKPSDADLAYALNIVI